MNSPIPTDARKLDHPFFRGPFHQLYRTLCSLSSRRGSRSPELLDERRSKILESVVKAAYEALAADGPQAAHELILFRARPEYLQGCLNNKAKDEVKFAIRARDRQEHLEASPSALSAHLSQGVHRAAPDAISEQRTDEVMRELTQSPADYQALRLAHDWEQSGDSLENIAHSHGMTRSKADTEIRRVRRRIKLTPFQVLERLVAAIVAGLAGLYGRKSYAAAGHAGLAGALFLFLVTPAAYLTGAGAYGVAPTSLHVALVADDAGAGAGQATTPTAAEAASAAQRPVRARIGPARPLVASPTPTQPAGAHPAYAPAALAPMPAGPDFGLGRAYVQDSLVDDMTRATQHSDWHAVLALSASAADAGAPLGTTEALMTARAHLELGAPQVALDALAAALSPGASFGSAHTHAVALQATALGALGRPEEARAAADTLKGLPRLKARSSARRAARRARR